MDESTSVFYFRLGYLTPDGFMEVARAWVRGEQKFDQNRSHK
jgi:hypothetical protein